MSGRFDGDRLHDPRLPLQYASGTVLRQERGGLRQIRQQEFGGRVFWQFYAARSGG
jgi:hypothetical protein